MQRGPKRVRGYVDTYDRRRGGYESVDPSGQTWLAPIDGRVAAWVGIGVIVGVALLLGSIGLWRTGPNGTVNSKTVIAQNLIQCPNGGNPNDPLQLRIVSKNIFEGIEFNDFLGPAEGFDPPLPAPGFLYTLMDLGVATEQDMRRSFEHMWQTVHNESLFYATKRMDAMAIELAAQNADVLMLQNGVNLANNPNERIDGAPYIFGDYYQENSFAGSETSPEQWRRYNYIEMIQKRLKENHNQDFQIVSYIRMQQNQSPRTLGTVDATNIRLQLGWEDHAILVRKNLNATILREKHKEFNQKVLSDNQFLRKGDMWNTTETVPVNFAIDIHRGYNSIDLELCGKRVRLLHAHHMSGSFVNPGIAKHVLEFSSTSAMRNTHVEELYHDEVLPSPYPTILTGDLNEESCAEATFQLLFPCFAYQRLVGSVDDAGVVDFFEGGPMMDACVAVHGTSACTDTSQFRTGSPTNSGLNDYEELRDPDTFYQFRIDHIFVRRGDAITVDDFGVTLPTPLSTSPSQPFAFTGSHQGLYAHVTL